MDRIRVRIVADTSDRAKGLADLLAEEEQIDVLQAGTPWAIDHHSIFADVTIAAGVSAGQLRGEPNIVFLNDEEPVAFEAQGRAWLPPNVSAGELMAAIIAAAQNLTVLTPTQARRRLPGASRTGAEPDVFSEALTNRESQVLRMLANGSGNKEIAARLGISDHTAKYHVAQILAKLNAGSRTEAVMIAIRRGLVPI